MAIDREKLAKQAEEYLMAGKAGKAIDNFLKLLEDNPKDLNTANRIGDIYLQEKKQAEALAMFKRAAEGFEKDGFLNKAIAIYKKAFRSAPEDMDLATCLVGLYKRANMVKDAVQLHIQLADLFTKKGMLQRALQEFAEVVALEPRNVKNKIKLAELYTKEGMQEQASELFLEVAEMLAMEGKHAEASQILEQTKSMTKVPQLYLTHFRLCVIQRDFSSAKSHLDEGLVANPKNPELMEAKAEIEIQLQNPLVAIEILSQIIQMPEKAFATCERALKGCMSKGLMEKGLTAFSPAAIEIAKRGLGEPIKRLLHNVLGTDPIPEYWILLAEIAHQNGAKEEQTDSLKYALSLVGDADPRAGGLRKQLLDLGVDQNNMKIDGPPDLEKHSGGAEVNLNPQQARQVDQLTTEAGQHESLKRTDKAIDTYQKVLEIDPTNSNAIERIAEIHKASGVVTKAQTHYCKVAEKLAALGNNELAIKYLDKAEAILPGSTRVYRLTLGLNNPPAPKPVAPAPIAMPAPPEPPAPLPIQPEPVATPASAPPPPPIPVAAPPAMPSMPSLGDLDLEIPGIPSSPVASLAPVPSISQPQIAPVQQKVDAGLEQALSSIDFQLDYGSPEEAKMEIDRAMTIYQNEPELQKRLEIVEEKLKSRKSKIDVADTLQESSSFDLSDILDLSFGASQGVEEMHDNTKVAEKIQTAEELFNAFRDEVAEKVSGDDYDTHYNLGIAYKEMQLADPAIEAFKQAMADPERTLECCSMLALCEEIKGDIEAAMQWLRKGIDDPGFPPVDSVGLRYDLANMLARAGRQAEANTLYQEVQRLIPGYGT